jgi:hypothetical protein
MTDDLYNAAHSAQARAALITVAIVGLSGCGWMTMGTWWAPLTTACGVALGSLAYAWSGCVVLDTVFVRRERAAMEPAVEPEPEKKYQNLNELSAETKAEILAKHPFYLTVNMRQFYRLKFHYEQIYDIAVRVIDGNQKFNYGNFTPTKYGFSDNRFKTLQHLFVRERMGEWVNPEEQKTGFIFTAEGETFLRMVKDHPPTGDL